MKRIAPARARATGLQEPERLVFVVDDDQSVRTSLANLLSTEDYAVETFASAVEYLERAPAPGPACLVLDVRLPGLDGPALQRQLTGEGRVEQIVFITGHADIPMGISAMKRGAVDFLPKPFSDDELLAAGSRRWRAPPSIGSSAARWQRAVRDLRSSRHVSSRS